MARGLNKVMIVGNLGRDAEMRFTPSGKPVIHFSVAVNQFWKGADSELHTETEWFNVVAWGNLAENSKKHLQKGSLVYVEGRLQSRVWQDSEGLQHKSVEIVARDILLLSSKRETETSDFDTTEEFPF
jgi:single-strand DNA-binding protein